MTKRFLMILLLSTGSITIAAADTASGHAPAVSMATPADHSVAELADSDHIACLRAGAVAVRERELDGSFNAVCALPNGKRCNISALQAGNCG